MGFHRKEWSLRDPGVFSPNVRRFAGVGTASPVVSVVMASYNDRRFLRLAIEAVLAQTFSDFELIVVDNGSNDPEGHRALEKLDARIRVIRLAVNSGPPGAGNAGITVAQAPIIARMDSDDLAEPLWLERLIAAFEADPELGLVGTWVTLINEAGDRIGQDRTPQTDFAIRFTMLSHNPFYQSSVAFRRALFELVGPYEDQYQTHDHRLWHAILPHCRARNLPEALVRYRYNRGGVTGLTDKSEQRGLTRHIRDNLWRELGCANPLGVVALGEAVEDFLRGRPSRDPGQWAGVQEVLQLAIAAALRKRLDRLKRGAIAPPNIVQRIFRTIRMRGLYRTSRAVVERLAGR
jgi:glycosyltransferase involved in cell wall biosynthesis